MREVSHWNALVFSCHGLSFFLDNKIDVKMFVVWGQKKYTDLCEPSEICTEPATTYHLTICSRPLRKWNQRQAAHCSSLVYAFDFNKTRVHNRITRWLHVMSSQTWGFENGFWCTTQASCRRHESWSLITSLLFHFKTCSVRHVNLTRSKSTKTCIMKTACGHDVVDSNRCNLTYAMISCVTHVKMKFQ